MCKRKLFSKKKKKIAENDLVVLEIVNWIIFEHGEESGKINSQTYLMYVCLVECLSVYLSDFDLTESDGQLDIANTSKESE